MEMPLAHNNSFRHATKRAENGVGAYVYISATFQRPIYWALLDYTTSRIPS